MSDRLERDLVREGLTLAEPAKRIKAFILDEVLLSLVIFVAFWDRFAAAQSTTESLEVLNSLVMWVVLIKIAYHTIFIAYYGATLGKLWQRIFVITQDGFAKPPFLAALSRSSMRVVSEWLFYFGFLWAFVNPNRQTWQDKIARTLVVNG
ncbi:MAG: RDD family protein [Campylobacterales bacterium]